MLEHQLNISPDTPVAPDEFPVAQFATIFADKQYRIFHRLQAKFFVNDDGTIRHDSVRNPGRVEQNGPTKVKVGWLAGEMLPYFEDEFFFELGTLESETNAYHQTRNFSADRHQMATYATGRVGIKGRKPNWRLFGLDAPWIFSEIIFTVDENRTVHESIRTSVDVTWANGDRVGERIFNNLNIYRERVLTSPETGEREVTYLQAEILEMEGQLRPFVYSASGEWPEPDIPPSVWAPAVP